MIPIGGGSLSRGAIHIVLAGLVAACGGVRVGDVVLRAAVTVDYQSQDSTLVFRPGDLEFGSDVWATHPVEFEISTDDWIQHLSLYDRYVVEESELVPAQGASVHDYTLSDEGFFGGTFDVEVGELSEGNHRAELSVAISLEPPARHTDLLTPRDVTMTIDLVYHVWTESTDTDPGFPTVEELQASDIENAQDLNEFLGCSAVGSYHHGTVNDASDALSFASSFIRDMPEMKGHAELVEAVPIGDGVGDDLWAIVDSNGYVVGSVEQGQAVFMCENKPPYYEPPNVGTPYPPCEGPDERHDPDCGA